MDPQQNRNRSFASRLRQLIEKNLFVKLGEILLLFLLAFLLIQSLAPLVGENLVMKQAIIWLGNVFMLIYVWLGLKVRGQGWSHFGLGWKKVSVKEGLIFFLKSLLVFVIGIAGFMLGAIVMANITGIPEQADMSNYTYLQDNLPLLLLTLLGVYIVSSFGEEVVYRGFLINRITEMGLDTKWGRVLAVIFSGLIFGLVHWEWGPMGVGQTTFMGMALGGSYFWFKKRLWLLVVAHAFMDTILMVQLYMASNG